MEKINPNDYQAIIFDLGGVILNIDYDATINAFQKLGFENFDEVYSQAKQSDLFDRLETGRMTPEEFRDEIRSLGNIKLSDQQIDDAWNAMLLDLPRKRVEMLNRLKETKPIYLLSNTNKIHYIQYHADLIKQYGTDVLSDCFEASYFSHDIGKRKPHPETFLWVCKQHDLRPSETLFIDDSIQHVEGALKAGLQVCHKPGNQEVTDLLIH